INGKIYKYVFMSRRLRRDQDQQHRQRQHQQNRQRHHHQKHRQDHKIHLVHHRRHHHPDHVHQACTGMIQNQHVYSRRQYQHQHKLAQPIKVHVRRQAISV
ncbi:MAG: hypothetical protein AAB739_04630, partial [Patescibacteria group bacterium]